MRHVPRQTWVGHPTDHGMTSNYTPEMLICYPGYWNQEFESCQWCSGEMMTTQVWICYPTISLVLYEAWTTSDMGESPQRSRHNFQLHPRDTQMLP